MRLATFSYVYLPFIFHFHILGLFVYCVASFQLICWRSFYSRSNHYFSFYAFLNWFLSSFDKLTTNSKLSLSQTARPTLLPIGVTLGRPWQKQQDRHGMWKTENLGQVMKLFPRPSSNSM